MMVANVLVLALVLLAGNFKLVDRSVQLDAAATPTIRRGPGGTQVANQRDQTGSLRGDVGVPIKVIDGLLFGAFETTINRDLVGHWNRGAETIFNEWEMDIPHLRRSDGLFSEIEWLPVWILFHEYQRDGYTLDLLLSGKAVGSVKYKATDSVGKLTATANYYLHYHPEAEKTGEVSKKKWSGPLFKNVDVGKDFQPTTIASFSNGMPSVATVQLVMGGSPKTYTFSHKHTWNGSAGFEKALELQLGGTYEKNTSEAYKVGQTYPFSVRVLPGQTVVLEVFPYGEVSYPVLAAYGPNGFIRDVPVTKVEFRRFGYRIVPYKGGGAGRIGGGGGSNGG